MFGILLPQKVPEAETLIGHLGKLRFWHRQESGVLAKIRSDMLLNGRADPSSQLAYFSSIHYVSIS